MHLKEGVIATTHVDKQGDQITLEAIHDLVDHISRSYIPIGIENDPRIPPQGRVIGARVRARDDGEHEVVATLEFFEDTERPALQDDSRELILHKSESDGLNISHGWSYRGTDDQTAISEISSLLHADTTYHAKKAADPISLLAIGGTFVLGAIAGGFFNQIGVDTWNAVRSKISSLLQPSKTRSGDRLLSFQAEVEHNGNIILVEVIQTSPTDAELDEFINLAERFHATTLQVCAGDHAS